MRKFSDFENHRLSGSKTDLFYKNIAEPFVQNIESEIAYTYFDIRNYLKTEDSKLIALEFEIDQLVYELYRLTEEEIAIVEGSITNG